MNLIAHPYQLRNRELLRLLMQHTGSGQKLTVRSLAEMAGCAHGTIGNLLSGAQDFVPLALADRITRTIGVDLLVLFAPTGRSIPAPRTELALAEAVPA